MFTSQAVFNKLGKVDTSEVQKKLQGKFDYIPWPWVLGIMKREFPVFRWDKVGNIERNFKDNTVTVWTSVTVGDGDHEYTEDMFLTVMDHRNQAIQNPTARQINDTRMRCFVKCCAAMGLGLNVYADESLPIVDATVFQPLSELIQRLPQDKQDFILERAQCSLEELDETSDPVKRKWVLDQLKKEGINGNS